MERRKDASHEPVGPHFQMFPTVEEVGEILLMADNDRIRLQQIAEAIESRPMIAAAVMKTVNAVSVGAPRQIHSVRHALAMIGMQRVREILLEVQHEAVELKHRAYSIRINSSRSAS